MSKHESHRGGLVPGLVMIVVGALFMLERFDYISAARVWDFWPLILIVIGLKHVFVPRRGRRSIFLLLLGIWLQISVLRFWGLGFDDSWPLLLIFVGTSIIFDSYVGSSPDKRELSSAEGSGGSEPVEED